MFIDDILPLKKNDTAFQTISKMKNLQIAAIEETAKELDYQKIQNLVSILMKTEKIDFYGIGINYYISEEIRYLLTRIGKKVTIRDNKNEKIAQVLSSNKDNVAFVLSHTGEEKEQIEIAKILKSKGTTIVTLTGYKDSLLAKLSDFHFYIKPGRRFVDMGPIIFSTSTRYVLYTIFGYLFTFCYEQQKEEFERFHGPILMTTNCIVPPKDSYKDRLYTTGAAGYPGCTHIDGEIGAQKDFSALIEQAKHCSAPEELEHGEIIGGFAHNQVLTLASQIVEAVNSGAIKKFVVMAGCDGRANSRNYYTDFARALPKDAVILTAGCAKYKYNKLNLGDINGIPRVLDAGQCNDSYSLAVIALKLKEVFGLDDINDLPIVYNIAWYEQKAVIVLLTLLALGVKNIHLGPTLPAFLSPDVAKILTDTFGIAGIGTVEDDLKLFFGK